MNNERPRRVNGLAPPYTSAQLSTWVFLPLLVLEFLLCVSPLLPLEASIPCTLLFCFFAAAATCYAYMAMKLDPADPRLLAAEDSSSDEELNNNTSNNHTATDSRKPKQPQWDPEEPTKQCWICDIQVGEKSMHCKFCNKCVDHFDHHCMCK
jgi:palmitoyltransferase